MRDATGASMRCERCISYMGHEASGIGRFDEPHLQVLSSTLVAASSEQPVNHETMFAVVASTFSSFPGSLLQSKFYFLICQGCTGAHVHWKS
jgi:hypothetical protein